MKEVFFESFFSLTRLFLSTKDEFFKQKLAKKTKEFFIVAQDSIFVAQADLAAFRYLAETLDMAQHSNHVAQYQLQNLFKLIDDLNELIDILIHLKTSELSPALLAQKNLLRLRSEILGWNLPKAIKKVAKEKKARVSKETILNLLQNKPAGASTKELFSLFENKLSRRTVQRHLNVLLQNSLILKSRKDGLLKYYLAN